MPSTMPATIGSLDFVGGAVGREDGDGARRGGSADTPCVEMPGAEPPGADIPGDDVLGTVMAGWLIGLAGGGGDRFESVADGASSMTCDAEVSTTCDASGA